MTALHSDETRRLAEALASARVQAGLTQRQLAELAGMDHTLIAKYETSRRRLDVIEFLRIATALKLDREQFFTDLLRSTSAGKGGSKP